MIAVAFILVAVLGFLGGFYHRAFLNRLESLEFKLKDYLQPNSPIEPESTFLDPDDVLQAARFEQAEIQRKLNPGLDD